MEPRQLLIIDDEESIHLILKEFLVAHGYTVLSARDGPEGLSLLQTNPTVRVVLTDIRLPGQDGLEVLREIKSRDPLTQVILMTAYSDKNLAVQALKLGADDYLEKPFRLEDLARTLDQCFKRVQLFSVPVRWHRITENLPVGVIACAADGRVEAASAVAEEMLAVTGRSVVGMKLWDVPGLEGAREALTGTGDDSGRRCFETDVAGRSLLLRFVDGPVVSPGSRFTCILTDVSDQKTLQDEIEALSRDFERDVQDRTRALTTELEFSKRLLDTAGVLIAVLDSEGHLVRLNKFAEEITRFSREEAEHVFSSFVKHPESPLSRIFNPNSSEELTGIIADLPVRDGTKRLLNWTTRNLPGKSGEPWRLIIGVDVTEQKQLEAKLQSYNLMLENMVESRSRELHIKNAQLIHSARLASLGEMAAGITHEMKQPLNVISITADLIRLLHRNGTLTDDLLLANLAKIRQTVDRMANTINHLRGFTHIDSANFKPVRLDEAVEGALSILGEQIRLDDIEIIKEVPEALPTVMGELAQIEQVLVNFMQNARDAIEERSRLYEAQRLPGKPQPRELRIRAGCVNGTNREVFVEVHDTGIGMDAEVQQRLFEPFFTTKEPDRGTGLGLSICMNIVQSHGGVIEVESELGKGSIFRMILPARPDV